jgi:hypothetical protein
MGDFTRFFDPAAEKYNKVAFKTDSLFNEPAPEPLVAFMIGGVSYSLECRTLATSRACQVLFLCVACSSLTRCFPPSRRTDFVGRWIFHVASAGSNLQEKVRRAKYYVGKKYLPPHVHFLCN